MITLQRKGQLKQAALIVALGVGVTVGGVAAGALVLQPAVAQATQPGVASSVVRMVSASASAVSEMTTRSRTARSATVSAALRTMPEPVRRLALPILFGAIALTGFTLTGLSYFRRDQTNRPSSSANSRKSGARPNGSKTPKTVQALADSGAQPSEIAWRTGLSLDAVAMLLSIGPTGRQLRPPTA